MSGQRIFGHACGAAAVIRFGVTPAGYLDN
jgi:hypothetical protein